MTLRGTLATLLLLAVAAGSAPAAPHLASRVLPLDHWAYDGIRLLRTAGYLETLNPLVQPYHRGEVASAVEELDPGALPAGLDHWGRLLREEFAGESEAWGAWLSGGARGATSRRLDPLRPLGDEDGWLFGRGGVWIVNGPLAAELGLRSDQFLDHDPDGLDPQWRFSRTETGYVEASAPHGSLLVGRLARNWSRLGTTSVLVSPVATTYAQIGFTATAGRFTVRSFLGELDSLNRHKRFLAAHRIDLAWPDLVLTLGESILLAQEGGGLPLRHLSPVEVFFFDTDAEPKDIVQNLMLQSGFWLRRGSLEMYGEAMLDDIDIAPPAGQDAEPASYAFTLGARRTFRGALHAVGAEYTQVAAWAYRTPNEVDRYSFLGRGLGEEISDFDRLTLSADLFPPVPGLRLTPVAVLQRRGEGSFRAPVPDGDAYLESSTLFLGETETTRRLALRGRYQPRREVWVAWDLGLNDVTSPGHAAGESETGFEGAVEIGFRTDLLPR